MHCLFAFATSEAPKVETSTSAVEAHKRDEDTWGVAKGAMLADASLLPKAVGTNLDKAASLRARLPAHKSPMSLLEGGARRRSSAGAGKPAASNALRSGERVGRSGELAARGPTPAPPSLEFLRTPHLMGSGRLWIPRTRLLLLR
jgi:hypothetical protein